MICTDCLHAIQRTYSNGPQIQYVKHYCDLDGQEIIVQIADCTRFEEKVVCVPPTTEQIVKYTTPLDYCLHHATIAAGGSLKDDKCTVCGKTIDELREPVTKGKPRAKRK